MELVINASNKKLTTMQHQPRAAWRDRLYEIIFEADTRAGQWFDIALLWVILVSVAAVCLETVNDVNARYGAWITAIEWTTTVLFTIEYILRLIAARRPGAYAVSFYGVVDLLSFLPSYLTGLGLPSSFAVIRSFRLLRVFRILKLFHLTSESDDLGRAVWQARSKIVVFLAVVLITVTIAGTAMYEVERLYDTHGQTQFTSIPQSIYWAVVTMTTVGYGDIVPETTPGKMLSTLLILVGYSLIIVPTGFVSAEIVDSKMNKNKSTQTCPYCFVEGHLKDAIYCRKCGKLL